VTTRRAQVPGERRARCGRQRRDNHQVLSRHLLRFGPHRTGLEHGTRWQDLSCNSVSRHGGPNEFDLLVHDNVIHGTVCDGLNFASVDPSQGAVVAYTTSSTMSARAPTPPMDRRTMRASTWPTSPIWVHPGAATCSSTTTRCTTVARVAQASSGAIALASGPVGIQMDDNLIVALTSEGYFSSDTGSAPEITGSNNLLYGAGTPPSFLTASVSGDPMLVAPTSHDFHLTSAARRGSRQNNQRRNRYRRQPTSTGQRLRHRRL